MKSERAFFKLAAWNLACRYSLMGGVVEDPIFQSGGMEGNLQGLRDSAISLRLLCRQELGRPSRFVAGKGWEWQ